MDFETVMEELEALGKERTKKTYISNGAYEPVFGVATGAMKPLAKKNKSNQELAEQLYATGNYDAMYFAGMIADPTIMTEADFERWIDKAYFYMLSDYVVAVTLAETDIAQKVSDQWIESGKELRMSAGWSCYCWLFGNRPDDEFNSRKISVLLDQIEKTIQDSPERTKASMCNFVYTAAISFIPVHEKAVEIAKSIGTVEIKRDNKKSSIVDISANIQKDLDRGALGFKRKYVRC
ncbi:DNA alkylation repair protein [Ureibacillus aquaedulcis]|uniref:DNA alkylation repair protein n=1 Tax=Ureibacillus aquaedulcis TaxID=3058421 RepID=A0ABT8GNB7_9BACL|nr:DNA alkylation repair protein [Ureibacillus sp. BA0131]MDN4492781.1 DNA alkylation repair protein [Ureibacillus sp. BA0131]